MKQGALKPNDSVPLHLQAEEYVRKLLQQTRYQQGARLPDELSLCKQLGISRGTMREAFKRLVHEGLIERRAGIGTRAMPTTVHTSLTSWPSFTQEMAKLGISVATTIWDLTEVTATTPIANALQLRPNKTVLFLDRLRTADGKPAVQFHSWFHPRLGDLHQLDRQKPLYDAIRDITGIEPARSDETISAATANVKTAKRLNITTKTPVLIRERIVRDANGRPFEYAIVTYRADCFSYSITLDRNKR